MRRNDNVADLEAQVEAIEAELAEQGEAGDEPSDDPATKSTTPSTNTAAPTTTVGAPNR
ncbi:MAG: hypothetical protein AAGG01_03020 [Planctomycetota bacterium]